MISLNLDNTFAQTVAVDIGSIRFFAKSLLNKASTINIYRVDRIIAYIKRSYYTVLSALWRACAMRVTAVR